MNPFQKNFLRGHEIGTWAGAIVMEVQEARTSMRLGCAADVKMGIGCDTGSSPIRIRFALSDSFSHARASSCSA
jgi:hypothetical protein